MDFEEIPTENEKSLLRKLSYITIICLCLATLIPSKSTFVLISASEIGERIYKSEQIKGVIDPSIELLQEYIKREIQEFKKK